MIKAALPATEPERLASLREYDLLDTAPESEIDDLTKIASQICGVPVAVVSLVDAERQWFKSRIGLDVSETSRDIAFCAHAILHDEVFVVPDALKDERFADNPLVTEGPRVRFYAGAPLMTRDGHAVGTLCVMDKKPRELSQEQRDALQALSRQVVSLFELRRTLQENQQLLAHKDEFLRIASHDLKNPLTVINAGASVLVNVLKPDVPLSKEAVNVASRIHRQAQVMKRIIEDFLDAQAIEDGALQLQLQEFDLVSAALDAVEAFQDYAGSKQMTLHADLRSPEARVSADPVRIAQVAQNLVGNAIKFSPGNSRVVVSIMVDGNSVRFEVSDEGPGLTPEDLDKVFSKYARLSNAPTGGEKSSGLGLAISREFVVMHRGDIGVRNNDGKGATFWFTLPVTDVAYESAHAAISAKA